MLRRAPILLSLLVALLAVRPLVAQPPPEEPPVPAEAVPTDVELLDEVIVHLVGGRRVVGLLVEQSDRRIVLRLSGVNQTLPADKVTQITILPPILERYESMRTQIASDDFASLLQLALWLEQRERYDLAMQEVDRALAIEPTDQSAMLMRRRLEAKRDLVEKSRLRDLQGAGDPDADPPLLATESTDVPPLPRLTPEQINLIRVFEVNLTEPPKLTIEREAVERLIKEYDGDSRFPGTPEGQRALFDADPVDVLAIMFELRARDMYPDVIVHEDPAALRIFRERVHRPLIINSCATSGCHADPGAGRLQLVREDKFSDATVYTNFLILERFRLADATPLINYDEPAASPLVQMALDRDVSTIPHPVVPGLSGRGDRWRPVIRSVNDSRFADTLEWIRAMYRPRPEYPIELVLPEPPPQEHAGNDGPPR